MKIRTILCLLFFVCCFANAAIVSNPIIPPLADLEACDNNNDGIEIFDLSVQTPIILAAQSTPTSDYNVTYHLTLTDANTGSNSINANPFTSFSNQQTIYVRVRNIITSEFSIGSFVLNVYSQVIPVFNQIANLCQGSVPPILPSVSDNGIVGTWSPSTIDTSVLGTYIMTFTPDYSQCASVVTMAVTVAPSSTLVLVSSVTTTNQTVCVNSAISNIVYVFGGNATGATVTGLPVGLTASISGSIVTISGAVATISGFYPYTVTAIGGCYQAMNGSITVSNPSALTLISPPTTTNQTLCYNQPVTIIVYQIGGGATGASVTGLPLGVTTSWSGSLYTISGTPAGPPGQYNFTVTTTGGCGIQSLTGTINVTAPQITNPANVAICDVDGNNDGYYLYSLDVLIPSILGSQNPSNFTVNFYDNQVNAFNDINPILNLVNYQTYTHDIWFRVTNNLSGCYRISNFYTQIEQKPEPVITASSNSICVDFNANNVLSNVLLTAVNTTNYLPQNFFNYNYQWYNFGMIIPGATNSYYMVDSPFQNSISNDYSVVMTSTSALGCSNLSTNFTVLQSGPASLNGIGYSIVNNAGNQTITVDCQGFGVYEYSLDGGALQNSPIFQNVSLGNHTITITDLYGCGSVTINNIDVNLTTTPPPTGNTSQSFGSGATLANIQVSGQNIQWYSGANKSAAAAALPLNTLLVNGTTYYASQKIGGYESISRLPVTAQVSLSNALFELKGLMYAPNPVENTLSIKSDDSIDSISIYNFLGQLVFTKKCNATNVQLETTFLNSGNYFVKITSENKQSIIKIEKK